MTIDQTIERELLGGREVSIPFVGTLSVEAIPTYFIDGLGSSVIPTRGVLTISPDYIDHRSIIFILAQQSCGSDTDQATLIYNEWLTAASACTQQLVIAGVCAIELSHFTLTVDDRFEQLLCPAGKEPVSIGRTAPAQASTLDVRPAPRRTKRQPSNVSVTMALLIVIFAALYIVYYLFFAGAELL